eukprot:202061-Chlamydomonas_euryale.AAC.6
MKDKGSRTCARTNSSMGRPHISLKPRGCVWDLGQPCCRSVQSCCKLRGDVDCARVVRSTAAERLRSCYRTDRSSRVKGNGPSHA